MEPKKYLTVKEQFAKLALFHVVATVHKTSLNT